MIPFGSDVRVCCNPGFSVCPSIRIPCVDGYDFQITHLGFYLVVIIRSAYFTMQTIALFS